MRFGNDPILFNVFRIVCGLTLVVGFLTLRNAYSNPTSAILVMPIISFGLTQVWTQLFGGFWAADPATQYPSFFWGDLLILPFLVALPQSLLLRHLPPHSTPYFFERGWWTFVSAVLAGVITVGFRFTQQAAFPPIVLDAPWKMFHDFVVYPLFAFLFLSAAPALWYSEWGFSSIFRHPPRPVLVLAILPIIGLATWAYLGAVTDRTKDINAPHGVPLVEVRGYDWTLQSPTAPLGLDPAAKADRTVKWVLPRAA